MKRNSFFDAVGDTTHSAAEKGRDALYQAGDLLGDLGDYLAPKARDLGKEIGPRARDLADNVNAFVAPRAKDLRKKGASLAADARVAVQPALDDAWDRVHPYVDDARDRISPFVDSGRARIEKDLLPRFNSALKDIQSDPRSQEAAKRLAAARAALAGELELPAAKKKKSVGDTIFKIILASGLLAAVIFAIKKFLAPDDAGWQAHEPSAGYTPHATFTPTPAPAEGVADQPGDSLDANAAKTPSADAPAEGEPIAETSVDDVQPEGSDAGDADPFVVSPYGEGSYVGNEPPEGFVIKGNERSMKYHVEGSGGYQRTIADVWFDSEDAAQQAGFTKAQR